MLTSKHWSIDWGLPWAYSTGACCGFRCDPLWASPPCHDIPCLIYWNGMNSNVWRHSGFLWISCIRWFTSSEKVWLFASDHLSVGKKTSTKGQQHVTLKTVDTFYQPAARHGSNFGDFLRSFPSSTTRHLHLPLGQESRWLGTRPGTHQPMDRR